MTDFPATSLGAPQRQARAAARPFTRVAVFERAADAMQDWAALEASAPASLYQTRRWLLPWMATLGASRGITPMLVVAYGSAGQPLMLLPLGTERTGVVRVAKFLGSKDANFNMALVAPGVEFSARDLQALLAEAAAAARHRPDLFVLSNLARSWEGVPNPFAALPHQPSPSSGYKAQLTVDPETFLKSRLSGDARKKLNAKLRKLAAHGEVSFRAIAEGQDTETVITAYQMQKTERFRALGIADDSDTPASAQFLRLAGATDPETGLRAVEWHALECGGHIVAEFAGGVHRGRLHGMVTSFDMSPRFAVASPGDLLMQRLFADACQRGLTTLDLGVGEARYKAAYCGITEPLFDTIVPISLKGRAFARFEVWRLALKRSIKQSPKLWSLVLRLRKWRAG